MQNVQPEIRIHVFHTGHVCVSPGLPFKDAEKNPNPVQLTLLMPRRLIVRCNGFMI